MLLFFFTYHVTKKFIQSNNVPGTSYLLDPPRVAYYFYGGGYNCVFAL